MINSKCANTNAPIEFCFSCGKQVHTCERDDPVDNSYLCPVHPNGFEDKYGNWFCNDFCYKEAERIKKKLEEITPPNKELLKMVENQRQYGVPFKYTFNSEYFDFIIVADGYSDERHPMTGKEFDLIFKVGKKNGITQPEVTKEELKSLADFIYKVLDAEQKAKELLENQ